MASGPITSWQIDGETMETMTHFIFLGSKITADGDCSHEIKWHFLLGRKAMTSLDSRLKSRDITLPTKVHLVKATVFPVVMYGCESWTIKTWTPKNWCFWIMVLEKTLESPFDSKEIKPVNRSYRKSTLNILWKDWCWSWCSKYFGHLRQAPILWPPFPVDSLENTLMLGKIEKRIRGQ